MSENKIPNGYAETMDVLRRPKDWDIPGIIADVCENLRRENDVPYGQLLAVIDTLMFRMNDIAKCIHYKHAERITPDTIAQAAAIAGVFAGDGKR